MDTRPLPAFRERSVFSRFRPVGRKLIRAEPLQVPVAALEHFPEAVLLAVDQARPTFRQVVDQRFHQGHAAVESLTDPVGIGERQIVQEPLNPRVRESAPPCSSAMRMDTWGSVSRPAPARSTVAPPNRRRSLEACCARRS